MLPRTGSNLNEGHPRRIFGGNTPWPNEGRLWQDTDFSAYWMLQEMVTDPAYKEHRVQDMILQRICRFANAEKMLLCAYWPVSTSGALRRTGFKLGELHVRTLGDSDGEINALVVAQMRRLPEGGGGDDGGGDK
jgi:hypothetical protein